MNRKVVATGIAAVVTLTGSAAGATPPEAANTPTTVNAPSTPIHERANSIEYANSVHDAANCVGAVFHPYGDNFDVYQNRSGTHLVTLRYAYYPHGHLYTWTARLSKGKHFLNKNFQEGRYISFFVANHDVAHCYGVNASAEVYYTTGNSNSRSNDVWKSFRLITP